MIVTPDVEPVAHLWQPVPVQAVVDALRAAAGPTPGRPVVIAVDGRQGGGKSTLAARLAAHLPGAALVHTDDVAWWESFFGWDGLMANGILEPARRGESVHYRPPAWDARDREGTIDVPLGTTALVVEGVGSSRRSLRHLVDASVWVQSDYDEARRRGIARDGGDAAAEAFWDDWAAAEDPFLAEDRPWERAAVVVCGTPHLAEVACPATHVLLGTPLGIEPTSGP